MGAYTRLHIFILPNSRVHNTAAATPPDVSLRSASHAKMTSTYAPMTGRYAVVRLNPVAMVQHLDVPEAVAAAEKMAPKKYLVYIEAKLDLLVPDQPWYLYRLCPIAPSPRSRIPEGCLGPNTCAPIFPNTEHPTGRPSVHPMGNHPLAFPYDNCYHWAEIGMAARILPRPEGFNDDQALKLSNAENARLESYWEEDLRGGWSTPPSEGSEELQMPRDVVTRTDEPASSWITPPAGVDAASEWSCSMVSDHRSASANPFKVFSAHGDSRSTLSGSSESSCRTDDAFDSLYRADSVRSSIGMESFGAGVVTSDEEYLPLFELSYNLEGELKQEDIPSPPELFRECAKVVGLVAWARANADVTSASALSTRASSTEDVSEVSASEPSPNKRIFGMRPMSLLGRLKARARLFVTRVSSIHLPHVSIWY